MTTDADVRASRRDARAFLDAVCHYAVTVWASLSLVYLLIPVVVVVAFGFNDNRGRFNFTWEGFTLRHWSDPFNVPGLADAVVSSVVIGVLATGVSVVLGTAMAVALARYDFRGRNAFGVFAIAPLASPEVILGSALLAMFLTVNVATGFVTIVLAHIMFTVGLVVATVRARMQGMSSELEEAAMDLGAPPLRTFRLVTLPLIAPGIIVASLLAFVLSFDDFVITNFNSGVTVTFPLFIWGAARHGVPAEVNVISTVLLGVAVAAMVGNIVWQRRIARRERQPASREGDLVPGSAAV